MTAVAGDTVYLSKQKVDVLGSQQLFSAVLTCNAETCNENFGYVIKDHLTDNLRDDHVRTTGKQKSYTRYFNYCITFRVTRQPWYAVQSDVCVSSNNG